MQRKKAISTKPINTAEAGKITPEMYHGIFQGNRDGAVILTDMVQKFYDRMSYIPGNDPQQTAYREGQRSVVMHIINQCGIAFSEQHGKTKEE